eukprot:7581941-Pyramimonas_sp.AAC.1
MATSSYYDFGGAPPKKTEGDIILERGVSPANLRSGGDPRPPPLTGTRRREAAQPCARLSSARSRP